MIVLKRKKNESIVINNDITIFPVEIRGDKVRLAIDAPKEVPVHRREVLEPTRRNYDFRMIILTRKKNEAIVIGDDITIVVVEIREDFIRLGIDAPKEVPVQRREVFEAIRRNSLASEMTESRRVAKHKPKQLDRRNSLASEMAEPTLAQADAGRPTEPIASDAAVTDGHDTRSCRVHNLRRKRGEAILIDDLAIGIVRICALSVELEIAAPNEPPRRLSRHIIPPSLLRDIQESESAFVARNIQLRLVGIVDGSARFRVVVPSGAELHRSRAYPAIHRSPPRTEPVSTAAAAVQGPMPTEALSTAENPATSVAMAALASFFTAKALSRSENPATGISPSAPDQNHVANPEPELDHAERSSAPAGVGLNRTMRNVLAGALRRLSNLLSR